MKNAETQAHCPLNDEAENKAGRYNPKNAGVAHCYQLHDTLRVLYATCHVSNESALKTLETLEAQIQRMRQSLLDEE